MLHRDDARREQIIRFAKRLRELREELKRVQTPEEIDDVSEKLEEAEKQFFSSIGMRFDDD